MGAERTGAAGLPEPARRWLAGTTLLTLLPIVVAVAFAPSDSTKPGLALVWLLFVGSSAHVGATAWFYTVPEVRAHMWRHPLRYVWVPLILLVLTAGAVLTAPAWLLVDALLAFFAWQFFHFQKQNLGIAALAARALGAPSLTRAERLALVVAGCGGIVSLIAHPAPLQLSPDLPLRWLFAFGAVVFAGAVVFGGYSVSCRSPAARPGAFVLVYAASLLFFAPVFVFASPYAAVAGITIAHGLQYLLLVGLLAGAPGTRSPSPTIGVLLMVNIALIAGLGLNQASHLHSAQGVARAVYGAYLGLVMAHFVIDAGLWRLRDEFPRSFLTQRLPYLLADSRSS